MLAFRLDSQVAAIALMFSFFRICAAGKDYQGAGLVIHNEHRANHHANALTIDPSLNGKADQCAQYYAEKGDLNRDCPYKGQAGENLYSESGYDPDAAAAVKRAVDEWYNEVEDFDFDAGLNKDGKNWEDVEHFTQVVWQNTVRLGMGYARSNENDNFVVGLYDPPGNWISQSKRNVLPPLKSGNPGNITFDKGGSQGSNANATYLSKDPGQHFIASQAPYKKMTLHSTNYMVTLIVTLTLST